MTVGERVKRRREECGLSVIELASRLQKSRSTVYRYESDEIQDMPITVLEPLANALSTTPAYLMGWTDDPEDYDDDDLSDVRSELIEYFDGDARKIRAFLQAEREDVGNETAAHYVPPFGVRIRPWADPLVDAYEKASPDTQRATCAVLSIPLVVPNAKSAPKMREMLVYTYPAAAGLPLYAESDFDRIEFQRMKSRWVQISASRSAVIRWSQLYMTLLLYGCINRPLSGKARSVFSCSVTAQCVSELV